MTADRWHEIAAATRLRELPEFLAKPEYQPTAEEAENDEAWLSALEQVHGKPWSQLRLQIQMPAGVADWHEPTIHTQADRDEWAQETEDDYQGGPVEVWDADEDHHQLSA
jgi:hypothetical protein